MRKRPLTRREQRAKESDVVTVEGDNTLSVNEPKLAVDLKPYTLQVRIFTYSFSLASFMVPDYSAKSYCSDEDKYVC